MAPTPSTASAAKPSRAPPPRPVPPSVAGPLYAAGIPIVEEAELERLCRAHDVTEVVFAYSDVTHAHVMHLAARALAAGAAFLLLGSQPPRLRSARPVVAVTAVRAGCRQRGSAVRMGRDSHRAARRIARVFHPMPYGD